MRLFETHLIAFSLLALFVLGIGFPLSLYAQVGGGIPPEEGGGGIPPDENGGGGGVPPSGSGGLTNPIEINSIEGFLRAVLNILQTLGFIVAVVFIVYAGFLYVTAAGDETQIKKAHSAFLWSVIGLAVLLGAMIFADAIKGTVESIK